MIRRPPRSTRTDTLVPYTTLFRSGRLRMLEHGDAGAALPFQRRLATDMRRLAPVLRALDVEAQAQAVLRLPCDEAGRHFQFRHVRLQDAEQIALLHRPAVPAVRPFVGHAARDFHAPAAGPARLPLQTIGPPARPPPP